MNFRLKKAQTVEHIEETKRGEEVVAKLKGDKYKSCSGPTVTTEYREMIFEQ